MMDLEFKGHRFTWSNDMLNGDHVKERLDWAMGSLSFRLNFPRALMIHLDIVESYHSIITVHFNFVDKKSPRSFKFESFWVDHLNFKATVEDAWKLEESDLELSKIVKIRCRLRNWSKYAFPNNRVKIDSLMKQVVVLMKNILTKESRIELNKISSEIERLWEIKEKYWGHRVRINWLKFGDQDCQLFMLLRFRGD